MGTKRDQADSDAPGISRSDRGDLDSKADRPGVGTVDQGYPEPGYNHLPRPRAEMTPIVKELSAEPTRRTSRAIRIIAYSLLSLAGFAVALVVAGVLLVQTAWFKNFVRDRIVAVVERATGGRVEIGSFSYNWHDLTADVQPFVLHGTEPDSRPPLFRAEKIQIGFRIISALEKKVDIASLIVESP